MAWHSVLIDDVLHGIMLLNIALEEVKRRVVTVEQRILNILLQRDFQLTAGVALSNLEQRRSESFHKSLSNKKTQTRR